MFAVVNVDRNWGIGAENRLLVSIRADLRRFRALTEGKTVIYGRKTLETFPNGRPLKNRRNLILSRDPSFSVEDAEVFRDIPSLFAAIGAGEDCAVIGGASVYAALLPYCDRACVTETLADYPADRFFPDLAALPNWVRADESEVFTEDGVAFRYVDYVNLSPLSPAFSSDS